MAKDDLFLLQPPFEDPAYPGEIFYCWHCMLMEGLIAALPCLAEQIDIHRIAWPRPRADLVSRLGPDNQSLPVLILSDAGEGCQGVKQHEGVHFIDNKDAILTALTLRHGIPTPHP
ncbi:DUF3088 domain-containing protein [Hyphomonas sp.]|uniref:DUF3088 domain-containing protein n=1 Tax=Hyphomonas sp. TaxID=87 RepID=UPI0030014B07